MELIETNIENSGSSVDFNTVLEQLEYYTDRPMDINSASRDELVNIGLFSNYQIDAIIKHRETFGGFIVVDELRSLAVFTEREMGLITPYLTTKKYSEEGGFWNRIKGGSHLFLTRFQRVLEDQAGYTVPDYFSSAYEGDPWKVYSRYRYNSGYNFSVGFTLEKDQGEALFRGSNVTDGWKAYKGFDYSSAHLLYRSDGFLKTVALGDYELRFGQGLIMWNGIAFRKSAYVMNVMKSGPEVKQYTSVNEFNYLRGAAAQFGTGKVTFTTFYSNKDLDANIISQDTIDDEVLQVSSFQESGYHRKYAERIDEASLQQTMVGGRASFNSKHFRVSMTGTHSKLGSEFQKTFQYYNQFEFAGDELSNAGLDYKLGTGELQMFGEAAYSSNGGIATINGLEYHPHPSLGLYGAHRLFTPEYTSFYANAFGERSTNNNESGVYLAAAFKPGKYWELWTYFDQYKHKWLKFGVDAPSRGSDYLVQLNYNPSSQVQVYFRFKDEVKQENKTGNTTAADYLVDVRQTRFRYHMNYQLNYYFSLKSRFEYALFSQDNERETGFLLYQDLQYRIPRSPFRFTGRLAYFDTESFDAAIYAYENDVLYSFSVPAYYYKGVRTYLILRVKPTKQMIFWVRYARTHFTNRNVISSDGEEIQGNTRSEIKFQLAWTF